MEKKNLTYIVGGIAVIGIFYYLYNKNKKPRNVDALAGGGQPQEGGAPTGDVSDKNEQTPISTGGQGQSVPTPKTSTPAESLTKKQARKQRKKDSKEYMTVCGTKPLLKKNRPAWQQCVDEQKAKKSKGSAFDGASNYFEITSNMSGNITDNMDIF
jgi:hypothetical protein